MAGTRDNQRTSEWYDDASASGSQRGSDESGRAADVSGWHDRTPTGIRNRVDPDEAEQLAKRPRQKQTVTRNERSTRKFDRTQFVAHVSDRMSFNRNGDLTIQIIVPYQFKHLAEPLTDAFGIPLSFDVEVWEPYQEANE